MMLNICLNQVRQPMWFSLENQANGHLSPLRSVNMETDWNRKILLRLQHCAVLFFNSLHHLNMVISTGAQCALGKTSFCSQKRAIHSLAFFCQGLSMRRRDWMRSESNVGWNVLLNKGLSCYTCMCFWQKSCLHWKLSSSARWSSSTCSFDYVAIFFMWWRARSPLLHLFSVDCTMYFQQKHVCSVVSKQNRSIWNHIKLKQLSVSNQVYYAIL